LHNDGFLPLPGDAQTGTAIYVTAVGANAGRAPKQWQRIDSSGRYNGHLYTTPWLYRGRYLPLCITKNGAPALHDTAWVIVYVCSSPHPVAVDDCSDTTAYVNEPGIINVLGNDILQAAQDTTVTIVLAPDSGTASVNGNFTITYVPDMGFHGHDSMTYRVCEIVGPDTNCSVASVCINVVDSVVACFFPNGFSPNGDGVNDMLVFPCNEKYRMHRFRYSTGGVISYGKVQEAIRTTGTVRTCKGQQYLTAPIISSINTTMAQEGLRPGL